MLKLDTQQGRLLRFKDLQPSPLASCPDLRRYVENSPEALFRMLGLEVVAVKARSAASPDLLAFAADGTRWVVMFGPTRSDQGFAAALAAAAFVDSASAPSLLSVADEQRLRAFVNDDDWERAGAGYTKVMLLAESYDDETLQTARWLSRRHGLAVRLVELRLARDPATGEEYLTSSEVSGVGSTDDYPRRAYPSAA